MWTCSLTARRPYVSLLMLIMSFRRLWRMKMYFLSVPKPNRKKKNQTRCLLRNAAPMCNTDGCEPDCLWFHRHCDPSARIHRVSAEMSAIPTCSQSVMLHVTAGTTARWSASSEVGVDVGPTGSIMPLDTPPTHTPPSQLWAHARQAVRSDITTSGPGAVFGTQADVSYETPLWEMLINSQFMADEFFETQ